RQNIATPRFHGRSTWYGSSVSASEMSMTTAMLIAHVITLGLPIWLVTEELLRWTSVGGRRERRQEHAAGNRARSVPGRVRDARGGGGRADAPRSQAG